MNVSWFNKKLLWFSTGFECALVLLIAWLIAGLMLSFLPNMHVLTHYQKNQEVQEKLFSLPTLLNTALFGLEVVQTKLIPKLAPPPRPAVKMVQKIKLNLQLTGVVYAGQNSVAFIVVKPGAAQEIFHVGDEILTGIVLLRVGLDSIYVSVQGQEQQILLNFSTLNTPLLGTVPAQQNPVNLQPQPRGGGRFSAAQPRMQQGTPQRINRLLSRTMLNKELQDFSKLLMQARVLPHLQDGKPDGFMISNISAGSLYQRIGLKDGDIIKMVNGVPIRSMEQAMGLYQQLRNAAQIEMSLLRQGQLQHIQFDIQ